MKKKEKKNKQLELKKFTVVKLNDLNLIKGGNGDGDTFPTGDMQTFKTK